MNRVIVIGGGPAGLMAAISATENPQNQVLLIEKNNIVGKKLRITGGGRGNITSSLPMEEFYKKVTGNGKFLISAFHNFSNGDLMDFMVKEGLALKIEGTKVYPQSNQAASVAELLESVARKRKVTFHFQETLQDILLEKLEVAKKDEAKEKTKQKTKEKMKEESKVIGIRTSKGEYTVDKLIIAVGGKSFPATGSDGQVLELCKSKGVEITSLYPGLVQLFLKESMENLQGISLQKVSITAKIEKFEFKASGDMIFTHRGISGPGPLDISSYISAYPLEQVDLRLDFLPENDAGSLEHLMFDQSKKRLDHKLSSLLPARLLRYLFQDMDNVDLHNLKKEQKQELVQRLKSKKFSLSGMGAMKEGIVTKGGISLKEINSSTLGHKKISGLYFAGECLDLDAATGGYNLQIAFSTGYLAGKS